MTQAVADEVGAERLTARRVAGKITSHDALSVWGGGLRDQQRRQEVSGCCPLPGPQPLEVAGGAGAGASKESPS
jgi:hypothetical protein